MGNKAPKSEPEVKNNKIPMRCIYIQGLNDSNQCGSNGCPFAQEKVVVSAVGGMSHCLAILGTGEFVSWGSNEFGQLGTEPDSYIFSYIYEPSVICPVIFPKDIGKIRIVCISAGAWHSACVTDTGKLLTWGLGNDGQLGLNLLHNSKNLIGKDKFLSKPAVVTSLMSENIFTVNCGSDFTVVRTTSLKVFVFGNGAEGVFGNGNLSKTHNPQEIQAFAGIELKKIACGWSHCLALTTRGKVYTWGNQYKDILEGHEPILYPKLLEELENHKITNIDCGDYHSCALTQREHGRLFVWGSNGWGQLGDPQMTAESLTLTPVEVRLPEVTSICCGGLYTIAILKNGEVWGWGCNRQKQLGSGFGNIINEPTLIMTQYLGVKRVSCGYSHSLFLSAYPIERENLLNLEDRKRDLFLEHEKGNKGASHDFTDDRI